MTHLAPGPECSTAPCSLDWRAAATIAASTELEYSGEPHPQTPGITDKTRPAVHIAYECVSWLTFINAFCGYFLLTTFSRKMHYTSH